MSKFNLILFLASVLVNSLLCSASSRPGSAITSSLRGKEAKGRGGSPCSFIPAFVEEWSRADPEVVLWPSWEDSSDAFLLFQAAARGLQERVEDLCNVGSLVSARESSRMMLLEPFRAIIVAETADLGDTASCDKCKMTVLEIRMVTDSPKVQHSLINASMIICDHVAPYEDDCKAYITTYGPQFFLLLDKYFQPDPVCSTLGLCPAKAATTTTGGGGAVLKALWSLGDKEGDRKAEGRWSALATVQGFQEQLLDKGKKA